MRKMKLNALLIVAALCIAAVGSAALASISFDRSVSAGEILVDTDDNVAIQITNISTYSGLVKTQKDGTVSFNLNEAINNDTNTGFNTDANFMIGTPDSGVIRIKNNSDIPVNVYMTSENNQAITLYPTSNSSSTIGVGSASEFYFTLDTSDQNANKSLNAILHVEGSRVQ